MSNTVGPTCGSCLKSKVMMPFTLTHTAVMVFATRSAEIRS